MAHEIRDTLVLPTLIFGTVEVRRLLRELETLDEQLRQMALRRDEKFEMPRVSRLLDALATENHCDLLRGADRIVLRDFLNHVMDKAPTIHVSFAADPSSAFTAKIVGWFRANVNALALVQIGLQPSIAAGCVVRTQNKVFDLSLRNHFSRQTQLLIDSVRGDRP